VHGNMDEDAFYSLTRGKKKRSHADRPTVIDSYSIMKHLFDYRVTTKAIDVAICACRRATFRVAGNAICMLPRLCEVPAYVYRGSL
jgi:hypothetical protein